MGLTVSKIFVEAADQAAVKTEIEAYVKKVGATALTTNEEGVKPENGRHFRTFVISRVVDGKVTVWEDGGTIADLTLAGRLSKTLSTKTYWMQLVDAADYAGYCRFESGKLVETKVMDDGDLYGTLESFLEKYRLPWFWDVYENPNGMTLDLPDEIKEKFAKEHGYKDAQALMKDQQGKLDFLLAQTTGEISREPKLPETGNGFIAFNLKV